MKGYFHRGVLLLCIACTNVGSFRILCAHSVDWLKRHLIPLCQRVELIWYGPPLGLRIDKRKVTSFDQWLLDCYINSPTSEREYVLTMVSMISWFIWKQGACLFIKHQEVSPRGESQSYPESCNGISSSFWFNWSWSFYHPCHCTPVIEKYYFRIGFRRSDNRNHQKLSYLLENPSHHLTH